MMLQVVLLMPVSAKTLKRRRTGSLLSTHVMSAINATLGPQIGSHFLVLYNTCGPVVKVVKVGFLTGFRYVPIHSPNSKTFQLIALNIERYLFTPPKKLHAFFVLRCIFLRSFRIRPPATSVLHFVSFRFGCSFHVPQLQLKISLVNGRN